MLLVYVSVSIAAKKPPGRLLFHGLWNAFFVEQTVQRVACALVERIGQTGDNGIFDQIERQDAEDEEARHILHHGIDGAGHGENRVHGNAVKGYVHGQCDVEIGEDRKDAGKQCCAEHAEGGAFFRMAVFVDQASRQNEGQAAEQIHELADEGGACSLQDELDRNLDEADDAAAQGAEEKGRE